MKNGEYENLATAIWQGNTLTIAALQDMTADDLHAVEKAIAAKYKVDISLNRSPDQIHDALIRARADATSPNVDALDRALREANAED